MRRAVLLAAAAAMLLLAASAGAHPPTVTFTSPAPDPASASGSFAFAADDANVSFECRLDGPDFAPCGSPYGYAGLGDGIHTFVVRATDTDTGEAGAEASTTWTIALPPSDTTPPVVTLDGPSGTVTTPVATITFTVSEPATLTCALDGAPYLPCSSPAVLAVADGDHTFAVTATDAAGNVGSASRSWTVDMLAPVATIASGPADPTASDDATFVFGAEPGASFECRRDGGSFDSCSSPKTYANLADGDHTFQVRAKDLLGNTGPAATWSWSIDTTPPQTTITGAPLGTVRERTAVLAFTSSEGGSRFECRLDDGAYAACSSPAVYEALPDGTHTFAVRARDALGNRDQSPDIASWAVDATPPVLAVPADRTVEADGPNGSKVAYLVTASDAGAALLPGAIACAPPSGSTFPLGATTVACSATDGIGNVGSASFQVRVRDTTPPAINAPDVTVTATSAAGIRRSDPALADYLARVSASDLVSQPTLANDAPETLSVGRTKVTFTARDAAGNTATAAATVTVLPQGRTAPPPDLTPPRDVRNASATGSDHTVTLRWTPPARDFDHVVVTRTASGRTGSARAVYKGAGRRYLDRRLRNDVEYRYVIAAYDRAGNRSRGVVVLATPKALLLARPKANARVTAPPLLRWAPIPAASYFNVQLWRGKQKVLSAWPVRARYQLARRWTYDGKVRRLVPGVYAWYVWPGLGPRAAARYGAMLGSSSFRVVARSDGKR